MSIKSHKGCFFDLAVGEIEIALESSAMLAVSVARCGGGKLRLGLIQRTGDRRSPLALALRRVMRVVLAEERGWPQNRWQMELPATDRPIRLLLDRKRRIEIMRFRIDGSGIRVEAHYLLSPLESRYLADNGRPHPLPDHYAELPRLTTDLHTHFAGCVAAKDLIKIGSAAGVCYSRQQLDSMGVQIRDQQSSVSDLPAAARDKLARALDAPIDHQITHLDMQRIYRLRKPITKSRAAFLPLCEQIAADYAAMGVSYAELSLYDIAESWRLAAVHQHLPAIEERCGVRLRFLGAMSRHDDVEWDLDYIERIADLGSSRYLAGVDFMGRETNSTYDFATQLQAIAKWADQHRPGFVVRVHAGENPAHPENVRAACELTADFDIQLRIGHGLYGVDAATLKLLRETGAMVEFNLQSNFALNNVLSSTDAPLARYLDAGVAVTLGTDGYGIYASTLPLEARAAWLTGVSEAAMEALHATEQRYLASREAHEARWTLPPAEFDVPKRRPARHYRPEIAEGKQQAREARSLALREVLAAKQIALLAKDQSSPTLLCWKRRETSQPSPSSGDASTHEANHSSAFSKRSRGIQCLAIAGAWKHSYQRIDQPTRARIDDILRTVIGALGKDDLIITGGTRYGVEGRVHDIADRLGATVIGALVEDSPADAIDPRIDGAVIVAENLYNKAAGLYSMLQPLRALVLFIGGGKIVSDEIQIARNLRVPYLLLENVPGASGEHAAHQPFYAVSAADQIVAVLGQRKWHSEEGAYHHIGANPSVDVLILRRVDDGFDVLLVKRKATAGSEPGKWALPGGFQRTDAPTGKPWRSGRETATQACVRELFEETHLDLSTHESSLRLLGAFCGGSRDPRDSPEAWSLAQLYGLILPADRAHDLLVGDDDVDDARWFSLKRRPPLAFDHDTMLDVGVESLTTADAPGGSG